MKNLIKLLDVTEDKIRFSLSKRPIIYAFVSGVGTVLFFRGVWLLADEFEILTGTVTLAISMAILLLSGSFLFHFLSNEIVISGLKQEKKLLEKTGEEIKAESITLDQLSKKLDAMVKKLDKLGKTNDRRRTEEKINA